MHTPLLKTAIRVWLIEILVSGFNFFVLMNLIYEPRWGVLVAHQIGMSIRIAYIFIFAYFLLRFVKEYDTRDLIHVGILWLGLTLLFEWVGSLAIGRSVEEILIGWSIFAGYVWPYVLLTYLCCQTSLLVHFLHQVRETRAPLRVRTCLPRIQ